jgi:hypothetical protein
MSSEVRLTVTPDQLLYLRNAVLSDLEDLRLLGEEGPCQEIVDEELRHGRAVLQEIERAQQTQVYAH